MRVPLTLLIMAVTIAFPSLGHAEGPISGAPASAVVSFLAPIEPAPIQDNSFLVEEAYNQEDGVIQHISFVEPLQHGRLGLYPDRRVARCAP